MQRQSSIPASLPATIKLFVGQSELCPTKIPLIRLSFLLFAEMNLTQCLARHERLLARVTAAPDDMEILSNLMEDYKALTDRMNANASLEHSTHMQAVNAHLLSELMRKMSRAFVAACAAIFG